MVERITQAAEAARRSDHNRLIQAQIELGTASEDLLRMAGTIRTAAVQRQQIVKAGGIGVLTGLLFGLAWQDLSRARCLRAGNCPNAWLDVCSMRQLSLMPGLGC